MYEIKDKKTGNMIARSRHFVVLRDECDKLFKERNADLEIVEVKTIRQESTVYQPTSPKWN